MAYKYFNISPPISTGCTILNDFQESINVEFFNAPDAFSISEEYPFASGSYVDVDVRVNRGISSYTGLKQGDDFKNLIFRDLNHATSIGVKYSFDNNFWLVINSETLKNFAAGCTIRRCNNFLRWKDKYGNYYSEPAILDYEIARPRDQIGTNNPVSPEGYLKIYCQANSRTKTIKGNQRFLFGPPENRICLKIFGDGIVNFLNQRTADDTSSSLLELNVGGNYINPSTDDIILGIADAYSDYGNLNSGSSVPNIVVSPSENYLLSGGSQIYNVNYYSGSVALSGSFVFTISGSQVPTDHYSFVPMSGSSFFLLNIESYMNHTLDILASGSSGSKIMNFELRGKW